MIITVPMICDNSLKGDNAIPLIAKAFERWVLLYSIDKITATIAKHGKIGIQFINRNENTQIDNYLTCLNEFNNISEQPKSAVKPSNVPTKLAGSKSVSKNDFSLMQSSLDVNPTWIKVTVKGVPRLVGVKVLPYFMNPDAKPINVIMQKDLARSLPAALFTAYDRRDLSKLWKILKGLAKVVGWHFAISGKAKDILYNASQFGENTLCCFGEVDLPTVQKIMSSARSVRNLYMMGWSGFALRIKSQKLTIFCTPQMKGLCSTVTDANLYASFGKIGNQVYNSVSDLSKAFKL